MVWGIRGAALAALALMGGVADRAAAQTSPRAWLGVSSQEITTDLREGLNYKGEGVLVSRVVTDSPADRAGVRKGDVLVSINARTIDTPEELVDVVRAAKVGQSVAIVLMRAGVRKNLSVKLGEWPAEEMESETPAPRAPSAPRAPRSPGTYRYHWNGDDFELHGPGTMRMISGRPRLGVNIQNLNEDMAEALNVPGGKGVLVTSVSEDSPASTVGIKGGDVIVEVAGVRIEDTDDLSRELRKHEGKVSIVLMRRGARRTVQPELRDKSEGIWYGDGDRRVITIPDVRRRVVESERSRAELEAEMRELREELRELKRQIEANRKN
jgi:serine protease Do